MVTFQVSDMTCGHCVGTLTKAVRSADANAKVNIDLAKHVVEIESAGVGDQPFGEAISAAGYTPSAVAGATASGPSAQRGGGCCGRSSPWRRGTSIVELEDGLPALPANRLAAHA